MQNFFFDDSQVITDEQFIAFVQEDAQNVVDRQATDTIPIIDDIRYYISNFIRSFSYTEEARMKHLMIDELLESLGLDG